MMSRFLAVLSVLMMAVSAVGQTITVGTIAKTTYCTGDTMFVPYTAQGFFNSNNVFKVQLSDANGSFTPFTIIGQNSSMSGVIPVPLGNAGNAYRVRVIGTSPYTISDTSHGAITVLNYPSPQPRASRGKGDDKYINAGFVGDSITLLDGSGEPPGSTYSWTFDSGATVNNSSLISPRVLYVKEGIQTGSLTVTNQAGCSRTGMFKFRIVSCSPLIPKNVHIVTGSESGSDPVVWVLPGGSYSTAGGFTYQTVFVEPGASLSTGYRGVGIYYLRPGCSFSDNSGPFGETIVGDASDPTSHGSESIDTLVCENLNFDYSLQPDSLQPPIVVQPISKTAYCVGDTLLVRYDVHGTFAGDCQFTAQLSDAGGSFTNPASYGSTTTRQGTIPVPLSAPGFFYRVRVVSTNPTRVSTDNGTDIRVYNAPTPRPWPGSNSYAGVGTVDYPIHLSDMNNESAGAKFEWTLSQDANPQSSTLPAPDVTYPTGGLKTGTLTVTNIAGCTDTVPFQLGIFSCNPLIPRSAHVVTGKETDTFSIVWVKSGGDYTVGGNSNPTVYAEDSSTVHGGNGGIYYIKRFASFSPSLAATVITSDSSKNKSWDSIFYCHDVEFDYTRILGVAEAPHVAPISIAINSDHLRISAEAPNLEARIVSLLGTELLAQRGEGMLDVDLASLPAGMYFAIVQAGNVRVMRKMVVVH